MQDECLNDKKIRGAFFTPPALCQFMVCWSLRSPTERIFEPSCGEAEFLSAAAKRLRSMGVHGCLESQLTGVEIHVRSAAVATARLESLNVRANIEVANIFDIPAKPKYDVVIGNPPFIRYQSLSRTERAKANQVSQSHGVRFNYLTNTWAPFLVHASSFLRPGGRLAFVLPAELLSVNYAAQVRKFLMTRFKKVALIVFQKRVFPTVYEEVVIVLAEGEGPTDHCELFQAEDAKDLSCLLPKMWKPKGDNDKWMQALLPIGTAKLYQRLINRERFTKLKHLGNTKLGVVTGNNHYFTMSIESVREWNVSQDELLRIVPPKSRNLAELAFEHRNWQHLSRKSASVYLFRPTKDKLSEGAKRYIAYGESLGIQNAHKCRVRSPWWFIPSANTPDLFLTYMIHLGPRFINNGAGVNHLNSIHGVTLEDEFKQLGKELLPIATINSLTLLGAELVGRTYGGGVLKLEPGEAVNLPLPTAACLRLCSTSLRSLIPKISEPLRRNNLVLVSKLVDEIVLRDGLGLERSQIDTIREGWAIMRDRRLARTTLG